MSPLFAILLPIIRPPVFLPMAIESVLAQSVTDFELLVICDGAPPETVACAEGYAQRDPRVKVFAHPKGARQGEAYRHSALATSTARYVAHICDDDLWMPNHLAEMDILLSAADFGNLLHVFVHPDGAIEVLPGDLGRTETRRSMRTEMFNIFGPTYAGYRMDAYRRLPEGWAPGPPDVWSDLHMWRKFLAIEDFRFATRMAVTALHFATPERLDVTLDQREKENREYFERIRNPRQRDEIVQATWRSLLDRIARDQSQVAALAASRDELAAELGRMTASRNALQAERDGLQAEHETLRAEHVRKKQQIATAMAARGALETEVGRLIAVRDAGLAENAMLAKSIAATQAELERMIASKSWRLTAPLRALRAKIVRGR